MAKRWGIIGCGWLGLPFAKQLIENGAQVIGSTTSPEKMEVLRAYGISPVLLSLSEGNIPQHSFDECDHILLNIPPSSLKENYANQLLKLSSQFKPESKIIFISSTSVYSDNNQIATEQDELDGDGRNAPYIIQAEKKLIEKLQKRLTIIRMAGLVGGNRNPVKFMSGKKYENGKNIINLIHLDDCIGLINKVEHENYFGEIINGCTSEHPTKMDYYTWAAEQINVLPPIFKDNEGKWKEISNKKSTCSLQYQYKYGSPFDFPI